MTLSSVCKRHFICMQRGWNLKRIEYIYMKTGNTVTAAWF